MTTEVAGELKEGDILFAHGIDDADGRTGGARRPEGWRGLILRADLEGA